MRLALAPALAAALLVCACTTLGTEDRQRLSLHLENAAQYYDQRHYDQAYQQWGKVLELDPLNAKARLGQAMVYYQLGLQESPEGVQRLAEAETRLGELRGADLDGLEWRAELGFALVHDRWVNLYARKVQQLEYAAGEGTPETSTELAPARAELERHARIAEASYAAVYSGGEQEAQYQLACIVGLAKMAAYRGDLMKSLEWARAYQQRIESSKSFWRDNITRFPKEAPIWQLKLEGAERQEAELRDLVANVLFKLGRLAEAEAELDAVVQLDPQQESGFLNRGVVRQARRDWDRARQDLRTFLAMTTRGDDDASVIEARKRLEEIERRIAEEDADAISRPPQRDASR